jgi:hypothetical protein
MTLDKDPNYILHDELLYEIEQLDNEFVSKLHMILKDKALLHKLDYIDELIAIYNLKIKKLIQDSLYNYHNII